ncbi:MAG: GNAT family N-acetyltransferase [Sulfurospirillaceae bacterium]|nr:GNAT family N-acetyltransferase [Sulfurospirillaceae bacterium]
MNIYIKQATPKNALDLSIMTGKLLQEIMDKINRNVFNFNQEETQKRAEELISKNLYFAFIAYDNHHPIGFISLYESYALYSEGAYGTIPELYVKPEYRSLKIGQQLIEAAKKFAILKHWKRVEVTTPPLPQFDRTLLFYEKNGFEISGGRKLKITFE